MARQFLIGELRTLVARALQVNDYAPALSARVRAVPDTRTIRYYTTLGLLSPPSEMRGRVAYYDETHVLQIVAIKQLQAQNLSLSDIQRKLVGLTNRKLQVIAKLPADFWRVADKYLTMQSERRDTLPDHEPHSEPLEGDACEFWLTPAALPLVLPKTLSETREEVVTAETFSVIRITMPNGICLAIELPRGIPNKQRLDIQALQATLEPLVEELRRQNLTE
jgi:DNA-binding transcriptional MerR regulator